MEYAPHVKATATSIWGASRRYLQFACANQPLGGAPANPAEVTRWCISDEVVRVLIQQSSSTSASITASARAVELFHLGANILITCVFFPTLVR
jgi:hypothetical protein